MTKDFTVTFEPGKMLPITTNHANVRITHDKIYIIEELGYGTTVTVFPVTSTVDTPCDYTVSSEFVNKTFASGSWTFSKKHCHAVVNGVKLSYALVSNPHGVVIPDQPDLKFVGKLNTKQHKYILDRMDDNVYTNVIYYPYNGITYSMSTNKFLITRSVVGTDMFDVFGIPQFGLPNGIYDVYLGNNNVLALVNGSSTFYGLKVEVSGIAPDKIHNLSVSGKCVFTLSSDNVNDIQNMLGFAKSHPFVTLKRSGTSLQLSANNGVAALDTEVSIIDTDTGENFDVSFSVEYLEHALKTLLPPIIVRYNSSNEPFSFQDENGNNVILMPNAK